MTGVNTTHPALPNYTGPDSGLAGFVHHDRLYEYCWSFKERIAYIRANKPAHELATRERCMVYLDPAGQPWGKAHAEFGKARAEFDRAQAEFDRAQAEFDRLVPHIEAQIRALVSDWSWDGYNLVFPVV